MSRLFHSLSRRRQLRRGADFAIAAALGLCVVATVPDTQRLGDRFQFVLPLIAAGCAAASGEFPSLLGRYLILEVGIKVPKYTLGDIPANIRPDGGKFGFPSGHTAVATFGAVDLVKNCARIHPSTKGALLLAAAFTGGSRIESGRHSLWQTMAGAVWGWIAAVLPWSLFKGLRKRTQKKADRYRPTPTLVVGNRSHQSSGLK